MQTIGTQHSVPIPSSSSSRVSASVPDLIRDSITDLLSYAHTSTCSAASKTFTQIVQPVSRFQVALDTLLPVLDSSSAEVRRLIQVSLADHSITSTSACTTNSGLLHLVFTLCHSPNRNESIQTHIERYISQGKGAYHPRRCSRRDRHSAIGLGTLENIAG